VSWAETGVPARGELEQRDRFVSPAELEDVDEVAGLGPVEQGDQLADGDVLFRHGRSDDGERRWELKGLEDQVDKHRRVVGCDLDAGVLGVAADPPRSR
jgi:hypothetical protein